MDLYMYSFLEEPKGVVHGDHGEIFDDDDVFYAELERRILVLINTADDENDDDVHVSSKQLRMIGESSYHSSHQMDQNYFDWTENDRNSSNLVPTGISNLWRSNVVNGTGVFIPRAAKSKRKNKPRRKNNDRGRAVYKAKAVANNN